MATNLLTAIGRYKGQFYHAGYNLGVGLGDGIGATTAIAVEAARVVAQKVLDKIKAVFKEASPSKETKQIGRYAVVGLANGLTSYGKVATKSAENMGYDVLDTTTNILSNLSTLLADDMGSDPVIRPVVDLSNVASGARAISGMLSNSNSIAVSTARSKELASSVSRANPGRVQNGVYGSTAGQTIDARRTFSFAGAVFNFKDKLDIRAWKAELDGLDRDDNVAHGSV